jgi:hypothetical protein
VEQGPCPLINDVKVIVHPGEVGVRGLRLYRAWGVWDGGGGGRGDE